MIDTIARLEAVYYTAKDIHYSAKGEAFYGVHLLMDRVAEGIMDQVDEIKETYFLNKNVAPKSAETLPLTVRLIPESAPDTITNLQNLADLIDGLVENIGEMQQSGNFSHGVCSLLDDISRSLEQKNGLIKRTIAIGE